MSIASSGAEGAHSTVHLTVRSLLADLWFALVFFVGLPAAVLRAAGTPLLPPPGPPLAVAVGLMGVEEVHP